MDLDENRYKKGTGEYADRWRAAAGEEVRVHRRCTRDASALKGLSRTFPREGVCVAPAPQT